MLYLTDEEMFHTCDHVLRLLIHDLTIQIYLHSLIPQEKCDINMNASTGYFIFLIGELFSMIFYFLTPSLSLEL